MAVELIEPLIEQPDPPGMPGKRQKFGGRSGNVFIAAASGAMLQTGQASMDFAQPDFFVGCFLQRFNFLYSVI